MKAKLKKLWNFFTPYEKIWFFSIVTLSCLIELIWPEEDAAGVNGKIIMALYLLNIFTNSACELLISKQSRWNFIVSLLVELSEILICIVLAYRFATLAATIFFWIPIDIVSFISWSRHRDREKEEITEVRCLTWWQDILIISGILIWTAGVGYLLTLISVEGLLSQYPLIEQICCYLDACVSAVGITNGLLIYFRYREQWIAWYISVALETAINILAGQWVLLVLKAGYLVNTTYGYIKWTKYIHTHPGQRKKLPAK